VSHRCGIALYLLVLGIVVKDSWSKLKRVIHVLVLACEVVTLVDLVSYSGLYSRVVTSITKTGSFAQPVRTLHGAQ
jgi:hypothetical protein